jgi:tetratricopeptide (TPR) repeat protein
MEAISAQSVNDPSGNADWNLAWVRVNGTARQLQAESQDSAYLLLDQLFYGDFASAVDAVRGYSAESIFNPSSPVIIGTVAEGNQEALSKALLANIEPALQLYPNDPESAPAYFLRAWAYYLQGDINAARNDMQQAVNLAHDDKLFNESLLHLRK